VAIVELHCQVADGPVARIDRIVQELTGRSRGGVRGLFDHDCVRLNDEVCTEPGTSLKNGDSVTVRHDPTMRYREKPRQRENAAFRLVFEDELLLVVDKAAAVLTVPSDRGEKNTLINAIDHYLGRRGHRGRAAVVHRLDRGTSGLLVFGKHPPVARELREQFRVRKAEREYAAIVAGNLARAKGTFSSRLGTTKSLQRYSVREGRDEQDDDTESAVTHFRVEERLNGATSIRVRLETGRRNQIRVHFAEDGHPVLGDERYRADLARHPAWIANRLALHATVLGFEHPRSHEWLQFESPLPAEFARFIARTRAHG
jgi:23S rRNA pseudouridine1911/1915/1917 synthase